MELRRAARIDEEHGRGSRLCGLQDNARRQAKLEQRFTHGVSFLVSYTRSKLIDEASSVFDASILTGPIANFPMADSFNRKLERDLSTGDIPNVFVASFTYDLPIGKGKILGGWELAGVVQLQSGIP